MSGRWIDYADHGKPMRGYFVPGTGQSLGQVLVVPEAPGLGPMPIRRADMLAAMGYDAFAVDLYGDGLFGGYGDDALALMDTVAAVPGLLLQRVQAGLEQLRSLAAPEPDKLFAIGYCFGGTGVLELARSGADLGGVVCFHGVLATETKVSAGAIKSRILVCTGGTDPLIPTEQISTFSQEMEAAGADYQVLLLGSVGHAFTSHEIVGERKSPGFGFDEKADARSWEAMQRFFTERS